MSVDDKEIGRVTSSTFSPRLQRAIALGYVKYDYLAPGTAVKIASPMAKLTAPLQNCRLFGHVVHQNSSVGALYL
jgi:glycine cleavage system aminomethyltransferase T